MQKDRDLSFDAFRGFAIIAVVALHAAFLSFPIQTAEQGQWNFPFLVGHCQLLSFCVPLFLFIAGYWIAKRPIESWEDYKNLMLRRLLRILLPYFFWSVLLLGYVAVRTRSINLNTVAFKLMTGRAAGPYFPYYFILVLVRLYILTPLFHYINSKRQGLTLVVILNAAGLFALYLSRLKIIFHIPVTLPFYLWMVFYEIGLLTGNCTDMSSLAKKLKPFVLPGVLISVIFMLIESFVIVSRLDDVFFAVSLTRYSTFLYSVFIIFGLIVLRERVKHWPGFLVILGRYSYGIYLIHMFILTRMHKLLYNIEIVYLFQPLYQLILVLITLAACLGFIFTTRKLFPRFFCERILGF